MTISRGSVAGSRQLFNAETVAETATVNSAWFNCTGGEAFSVWAILASDGTPDVNIFIDLSPLTETIAYDSTDTSKYVAHQLVDALATKTALQGPYHANNNAANKVHLDYPFCQARIRVVGDGTNPADTAVSVWVTQFN